MEATPPFSLDNFIERGKRAWKAIHDKTPESEKFGIIPADDFKFNPEIFK